MNKFTKPILDEIRNKWPEHLVVWVGTLLIAWFVAHDVAHSVIAGHGSKTISIFKNWIVTADHLVLSEPIEYGDSGGFHAIVFCITDKKGNNSDQEIKIKIEYEISLNKKDWLALIDDTGIEKDFIDKKVRIGKWYYKRQSLAPAKYIRYSFQLEDLDKKYSLDKLTLNLTFYKYF